MTAKSISERISEFSRDPFFNASDPDSWVGVFNEFRPDGERIKLLFYQGDIEEEICKRLLRIYHVTSASWKPGDLYFTIRTYDKISREETEKIVINYLKEFAACSDIVQCESLKNALSGIEILPDDINDSSNDDEISVAMYECLTDYLSKLQPEVNEIFLIKEAVYAIANDYFLTAFVLYPAMNAGMEMCRMLDRYFDIWRFGIRIKFRHDRKLSVSAAAMV